MGVTLTRSPSRLTSWTTILSLVH